MCVELHLQCVNTHVIGELIEQGLQYDNVRYFK